MTISFNNILGIFKENMYINFKDMDVTSNNLANVNTPGFKRSRTNFQELIGTEAEKGGTQMSSTQANTRQGSIFYSDDPMDMAINGEGYYAVSLPDGSLAYTRSGDFDLTVMDDDTLRIDHMSGHPLAQVTWDSGTPPDKETKLLLKTDGEIGHYYETTRTFRSPAINEKGELQTDENDEIIYIERIYMGEVYEKLGSIQISRFSNPGGLTSIGKSLLVESANSGKAQIGTPSVNNFGSLLPKALEQSNVDLGEEMAHLITLQRAISLTAKGFQTTDTMISQAIQMRR